jgi:glutamyl-tRNA synthetase
MRAAQRSAGEPLGYDGTCRSMSSEESASRLAKQEPSVVRLAFPEQGECVVDDALRGSIRYDNGLIDDQVLLKTDGMPTYHLANVVDDHLMEITHVIRAEEWISSTPKHLELYDAFGWQPPVFVHMPLLRNADKSKISKRKNPTSLEFYRRSGILPEAFLNFLGMLGYSMPDGREQFSLEEFIADLDLSRVSLGGPVFDLLKLDWLNGQYLRDLPAAELARRTLDWYCDEERQVAVAALVQERVGSLADYMAHADMFYSGEIDPGLDARHFLVGCASRKKKSVPLDRRASRDFFEDVISRLETSKEWKAGAIEQALRGAVERAEVTVGDGFMAVRTAISGRTASPPLFESIEALGRGVTLARLRVAIRWLKEEHLLRDRVARAEKELAEVRRALERTNEAKDLDARVLGDTDKA